MFTSCNPVLVSGRKLWGASCIFREGGMSWWDREQQGHTRGTVPPQVPLGAAWTFLPQFHGASMEFLPLAPAAPLGWQDHPQGMGLVSPQHLVPNFGDILWLQWCWGVIPILSQHAWPSCVIGMGLLAFLVELCWSLECNYCSFVGDCIPCSSECFANSSVWAVCLNWMKVLHKC